jgi:transcriptional regulator with XRE-family HTH domain
MNQPNWSTEHGNLLKDLRQKAGLDIATLARKHTLSTLQIRQLETGGDTAFYNANIKFATGKKLLLALGHNLPEVALTEVRPQIEPTSTVHVSRPARQSAFRLTPQNFAWPLLFLLVAIGLLGLYVENGGVLITTELATKQAPAPVQIEPSAPAQTPAPVAPVEPVVVAPPNNAEDASKTPTPNAQAALTPRTAKCNWQANVLEAQPSSPRKSADYVHLVAQQDVVVCIKDAEQRVATLELQAGDARSIYGPPPFHVYSAQMAALKIYFQGQFIKLPEEGVQQVQLNAANR